MAAVRKRATLTKQVSGVDLNDPTTLRRTTAIREFMYELEEYKACLVCSPASSGKTSFAVLLDDYVNRLYAEEHPGTKAECVLLDAAKLYGQGLDDVYPGGLNGLFAEPPESTFRFIVLDEGQTAYDPASKFQIFWLKLKPILRAGASTRLRVAVFATYGGSVVQASFGTPVEFSKRRGLDLLRLSKEEAVALATKFSEATEFHVPAEVAEAIFQLTGGHVGLQTAVQWELPGHLKKVLPAPPVTDMLAYLASRGMFNSCYSNRGIVKLANLNDPEKLYVTALLLQAGPDRTVVTTARDHVSLVKKGVLVDGVQGLPFSSPLQAAALYVDLGVASSSETFQKPPPANLSSFILEALSLMDPRMLKVSFSRGRNRLLLERAFQMDFYRASTAILGAQYFVSPDAGSTWGAKGFVDFYIDGDLRWMVELVRGSDRLEEHVERFQLGRRYTSIPHADWVILNFLEGTNASAHSNPKVWNILVSQDFDAVQIFRADEEPTCLSLSGDERTRLDAAYRGFIEPYLGS